MQSLVYRGAKEICGAVGIPFKEIATYVREHGLPAFKINGTGRRWFATHNDLVAWIMQQRDRYLRP